MKSLITFIITIAIFCGSFTSIAATEKQAKPLIQIALLLDTSGSMDGLLHQAKTQLWKIVNELATAKQNGMSPKLQVALYEYGKSSLSKEQGYLRKIVKLTTDLDKVSEELFALKTNGGDEYCGWVIKQALEELDWSASKSDFKAVYIAGNEAFTQMPYRHLAKRFSTYPKMPQAQRAQKPQIHRPQGKVVGPKGIDYREACAAAVKKGVVVNTIHCGLPREGISGKWQDGAILGKGTFMNINQNRKVVHIKSPQDEAIMKLNQELNKTYIPYGSSGKGFKKRQLEQDVNAKKASYAGNLQRALSKSSVHYCNASWDLVDAIKDKNVELAKVKKEDLPKNMQAMSLEERQAYIKKQREKREEIKQKIQNLNKERKAFVAKEMKKLNVSGKDTLDAVMIQSLHKQMAKNNFQFNK